MAVYSVGTASIGFAVVEFVRSYGASSSLLEAAHVTSFHSSVLEPWNFLLLEPRTRRCEWFVLLATVHEQPSAGIELLDRAGMNLIERQARDSLCLRPVNIGLPTSKIQHAFLKSRYYTSLSDNALFGPVVSRNAFLSPKRRLRFLLILNTKTRNSFANISRAF